MSEDLMNRVKALESKVDLLMMPNTCHIGGHNYAIKKKDNQVFCYCVHCGKWQQHDI